eukprot:351773-Chlamydomonas_euryale.AAC.16
MLADDWHHMCIPADAISVQGPTTTHTTPAGAPGAMANAVAAAAGDVLMRNCCLYLYAVVD